MKNDLARLIHDAKNGNMLETVFLVGLCGSL